MKGRDLGREWKGKRGKQKQKARQKKPEEIRAYLEGKELRQRKAQFLSSSISLQ